MRSWCAVGCVMVASCAHAVVVQDGAEIFKKWLDASGTCFHNEFADIVPPSACVTDEFVAHMQEKIASVSPVDEPLNSFGRVGTFGEIKDRLTQVYNGLESPEKIPLFLDAFRKSHQSLGSIDAADRTHYFKDVLQKYRTLAEVLAAHENYRQQRAYLLGMANRFFEFCFQEPSGCEQFKTMLTTSDEHPLVRLLYATMWHELAGVGWKESHRCCYEELHRQAKQGKEVVYIAGGCDIYGMLKHGIYNVRIIDPIRPTQERYYIPSWEFFVKGELGDSIMFKFPQRLLTMKRARFDEQNNTTTWFVYDQRDRLRGRIIFERRLCRQDDFFVNERRCMLMSFNELYFLTCTSSDGWWHIDPRMFPDDFCMHVKQLRKPVSKSVMCRMEEADSSRFQFIKLGTCVS
jgi:hypothetical protein